MAIFFRRLAPVACRSLSSGLLSRQFKGCLVSTSVSGASLQLQQNPYPTLTSNGISLSGEELSCPEESLSLLESIRVLDRSLAVISTFQRFSWTGTSLCIVPAMTSGRVPSP
eukprot:RCo010343